VATGLLEGDYVKKSQKSSITTTVMCPEVHSLPRKNLLSASHKPPTRNLKSTSYLQRLLTRETGGHRKKLIWEPSESLLVLRLVGSALDALLDNPLHALAEALDSSIPEVYVIFRVYGLVLRHGEFCKLFGTAV
jgi:hypothetical protein